MFRLVLSGLFPFAIAIAIALCAISSISAGYLLQWLIYLKYILGTIVYRRFVAYTNCILYKGRIMSIWIFCLLTTN